MTIITTLRYFIGMILSLISFVVGILEVLFMLPGYIIGFINRKIFIAGAMWCLDLTEKEVEDKFHGK